MPILLILLLSLIGYAHPMALPSANETQILTTSRSFKTVDTPLGNIEAENPLKNLRKRDATRQFQVFNVPTYASWSSQGWLLRIHGAAYNPPNMKDSSIDTIAQMITFSLWKNKWDDQTKALARSRVSTLLSDSQEDVAISFQLISNGKFVMGFDLPQKTDQHGEFEARVKVQSPILINGNQTGHIQIMDLKTNPPSDGPATAYFVPPQGVTILSDVDDILRVTEIWKPITSLRRTFASELIPIPGMPEILQKWKADDPEAHFHYVTTTPRRLGKVYMDFLRKYYPEGSFDFRLLNFNIEEQVSKVRKNNLLRVINTFPYRKMVLVGDTTNNDAMSAFPELALAYPDRISCILIRNVSATEPLMKISYDTTPFKNINESTYMFFRTPEDLRGIDVMHGGCRNYTFPQNVTFSIQEALSFSDAYEVVTGGQIWKNPLGLIKTFFTNLFA